MHLVVVAWLYVVGMAALVEAFSSNGTLLGALITFVLWGLLPLSIVLYVMATPARKRLRRQREAAGSTGGGDGGHHTAAGAPVAAERKEP